MSSKVKIYTKTGDCGETSLYGGSRVTKDHIRIEAYGTIDELNSLLGLVLSKLNDKKVINHIFKIQSDLFLISSYLAGADVNISGLDKEVSEIEKEIDDLDKNLPELRNFILPQGCEAAAFLFYTRTIARRAERKIISLSHKEEVDRKIIVFFNRLSDYLFIAARYINAVSGIKETIWRNN